MEKTYVVGPTSIFQTGNGLYALQDIPKGKRINIPYAGIVMSVEQDDIITKMLHHNADVQAGYENAAYFTVEDFSKFEFWICESDIEKFGPEVALELQVCLNSRDEPDDGDWDEPDDMNVINWERLYNNYLAYKFEFMSKGKTYIRAWNHWTWGGDISAATDYRGNWSLWFNEPPPYKNFYNIVTGEYQASEPNVKPLKDLSDFSVIKDIKAGDELLICYGPYYVREGYTINMDKKVGCGQQFLLKDYLNLDHTYHKEWTYLKDKSKFTPFLSAEARSYFVSGATEEDTEALKDILKYLRSIKDDTSLDNGDYRRRTSKVVRDWAQKIRKMLNIDYDTADESTSASSSPVLSSSPPLSPPLQDVVVLIDEYSPSLSPPVFKEPTVSPPRRRSSRGRRENKRLRDYVY